MKICGREIVTLTILKVCMLFAVLATVMVLGTLFYRLELLQPVNKLGIQRSVQTTDGTTRNFSTLIGFNDTTSQNCIPPLLDPFNKDYLPFYSPPISLDCSKLYNSDSPFTGTAFASVNGNSLYQLKDLSGLYCCYTPFFRMGDNSVSSGSTCHSISANPTIIPPDMDYITVICKDAKDNTVKYRDVLNIVHKKAAKAAYSVAEYLNIEIIGLDSVSHLNFIRQMPLSRKYLLDSLNAVSLDGYSIIASGTLPNFLPMLAGLSLSDFTSQCASRSSSLNDCPFIWKDFSSRGYLTNYAEDWGQLNDFWSFSAPPTDYYLRPYAVFIGKLAPTFITYKGKVVPTITPKDLCFGTRHQFKVVLDFMEEVRNVANQYKRPQFQVGWNTLLAHDNMNNLGLGDIPMLEYLRRYKESGAWNNTVLIVIGDHGNAGIGGEYMWTPNGNIEVRLPVAYIALPPWFHVRFPTEYRNLIKNSKKLTSAYDVFKTLDHMLNLVQPTTRKVSGYGTSLFEHISSNRTCLEAGITLEWCHPCHPRIPIDIKGTLAKFVGNFFIKVLNSKQQPKNLCHTQNLRSIKSATKWDSRDIKREVCTDEGKKGFEILNGVWTLVRKKISIVCKEDESFDIVTIRFTTDPIGSEYLGETMIVYENNQRENLNVKNIWITDGLQRVDRYAETGKCVSRHQKPFCVCKT